jgi:Tol biopolymer transport system component/regulation of enolase protein 1 (concanavalin A-like superfamily)
LVPALGSIVAASAAEPSRIGQFDGHGDIGGVKIPGAAVFNADRQEYVVQSSGTNMWGDHDEFQFVWKKLKGDFIVQTMVEFVGEGADPHRKAGIIVRSSLDPRSPHVNACRHGNGLTAFQFRRSQGAPTEEAYFYLKSPNVIQLERKGKTYTMSAARFGETFTSKRISDVDLGDEVYVGIYVCSHNNSVVEKAIFKNVRITRPAPAGFKPYQDYIGSDLETLDTVTGARRVVHHTDDSLQAPNWTPDGRALIYNRNGRMYRFDLASRQATEIDTGAQIHNNNDHALSWDGKTLGISNHTAEDGNVSMIYTMPVAGGAPRKITMRGPSYLHGWSPDGKYLAFTGGRDGDYNIYRIPAAGGAEERLTTTKALLDDGSEYTPDGGTIYFNSNRTGRMQIWRMRADGGGQEQVTFDDYNNWFPHVSPNGKSLVFLSYGSDVAAGDHPFYKPVYLRQIPIAGDEKPQVIAYLYGGQGTINVNSWSPDNETIAFVSNSDAL